MKIVDLEYERWLRDPRFSEAVDNLDIGTIWEWINVNASCGTVDDHDELQKKKTQEQD